MILWSQSTNPGKKMLGLYVYDATTARPVTWGHMFVRSFLVGYLFLGIVSIFTLYILFGGKRQRLIDRMSNTVVVQR